MKVSRKYGAAAWSPYKSEDIEIIRRELDKIERAEGAIRTSRVLELSRDKSHPLHPYIFKLTDREAAERWRLDAVRGLCRAVEVRFVDDAGKIVARSPEYVSCRVLSPEGAEDAAQSRFTERAYRSAERAFADPETRRELEEEAAAAAESFAVRYGRVKEFAKVAADARAAAARVRAKSRKAS